MKLYETLKTKPLILYGAGDRGVYDYGELSCFGIVPLAFCDKQKTGVEPRTGLPIISPRELITRHGDAYVIVCSDIYYDEILRDVMTLGISADRIIRPADILDAMPDAEYIEAMFRHKLGYTLNLDKPRTFNEKLNWLKLNDRKPLYTIMADKIAAREVIAAKIGEEYLVPLLGVWDDAEAIDFSSLPGQFVLKCNHDSGSVVVCADKQKLDVTVEKEKLRERLGDSWYWHSREWVYKDMKPRIMAQQYLGENINDYKILTFGGEPRIIQVVYDLFVEQKRNLYTVDWEYVPVSQHFPTDPGHIIEKPAMLPKMLECSRILARGIPHVRVDFWEVGGRLYFSEFTFYCDAGFSKFEPYEYDELLGGWLELPGEDDK